MCSHRMDNYQGDLADIVRGSGGATTVHGLYTAAVDDAANWQFFSSPVNYHSDPSEDFGDPFSCTRDPLQDIDGPGGVGFSYNPNIIGIKSSSTVDNPPNIFSRMLQISPAPPPPCDSQVVTAAAPGGLKCAPPPLLVSNNLQISSTPRNTGIKRRKSQAKKVVCIPAPAPANSGSSRASGEVVPSDLWAWRKYGQKPIKGSPYPRGYYRCSSSKGCLARKQVERSRTDPNMLVITYTSEHNHPWPTQRNALAGSTRTQPSKTPKNPTQKPADPKEEHKETKPENSVPDPNAPPVKEEMDQELDNQLEMDDPELDDGFAQTYKPTLADSNHSEDSFFAGLGEIETDPLDLIFGTRNKDLDPFSFYDWATNNGNIVAGGGVSSAAACGEGSRDS